MDSTLVAANVSNNSVMYAGPELITALKRLYRAKRDKLEEPLMSKKEVVANSEAGAVNPPEPRLQSLNFGDRSL